MEGARERLAAETAGGDLERSAGRPTGPEIHEPGDCLRTHLAIGSRPRRESRTIHENRRIRSGKDRERLAMHSEEHHHHGVTLRLVEAREESAPLASR